MCRSIVSTSTGFTPAAGSSRSTSRGRLISVAANSSSFRCPNESSAAGVSACAVRLKSARSVVRQRTLGARDTRAPCAPPALRRRQHEVLDHGQVREHARVLEGADQAAPGEPRRVGPPHDAAVEADLPAVGGQVAGDEVEDRRLARPVRPDQTGDRPRLHGERARVHGDDAPEALARRFDLEQRRHEATTSSVRRSGGSRRTRSRRARSLSDGRIPRGSSSITTRNTDE